MIKDVTLSDGNKIPQLGLGLWQVKNEKECVDAVKSGLKAGYTHFDTAQIYGNERYLGNALQEAGVNRADIFITTKIWNDNQFFTDLIPSYEKSLNLLQTNYADLLLLHFPVTELRRPAWRLMEDLKKTDRVRSIGVSNYTIKHLKELLNECSIKPVVNQVELHVFLQQPELVSYCQENDIVLEAYSPLTHGYRMDDPVVQKIADKHTKTYAQILIRWCMEKGFVVLPKSVHEERIKENIDVFDFKLDEDDMNELEKLDSNLRTCWDPTNVA